MATDNFDHQGPKYLTNLDWENHEHQRIVAACLVKAAYVLEGDRREGRSGEDQLAPPCIGAVFRLKAASGTSPFAPAMVIAVRGTIDHHDWGVNVDTLLGRGRQRHSCRIVMEKAESLVREHGMESNLWLCGHSLGATVATFVGDQMAKKGCFFTTFLFNPPYILNRRSKDGFIQKLDDIMQAAGGLVGALMVGNVGFAGANLYAVAKILHDMDKEKKEQLQHFDNMKAGDQAALAKNLHDKERQDQLQQFDNLNKWDPRVYVNPKDYLCTRYIKYFKNKKMKGSPNKLPKRLASATLFINWDKPGDRCLRSKVAHSIMQCFVKPEDTYRLFKEAHSIMQWWKPGLRVEAKRYVMA
ncbi:GDSL esterase/lipase At4g10955-like isoform X2 [Nymphaea colorata]|uniref:GDSL esterase/lipase At4g10955-like isoform X2 n=1 Tax=Nymphaea colorata TaxID=210225 RepID=UPI00214DFC35|nr:GDSL esterase/lipase At4g10955-like isoform X2 [Nymphaea colorata]